VLYFTVRRWVVALLLFACFSAEAVNWLGWCSKALPAIGIQTRREKALLRFSENVRRAYAGGASIQAILASASDPQFINELTSGTTVFGVSRVTEVLTALSPRYRIEGPDALLSLSLQYDEVLRFRLSGGLSGYSGLNRRNFHSQVDEILSQIERHQMSEYTFLSGQTHPMGWYLSLKPKEGRYLRASQYLWVPPMKVPMILDDVAKRLEIVRKSHFESERKEQFAMALYGFYQARPHDGGAHEIAWRLFSAIAEAEFNRLLPRGIDEELMIQWVARSQDAFVQKFLPAFEIGKY